MTMLRSRRVQWLALAVVLSVLYLLMQLGHETTSFIPGHESNVKAPVAAVLPDENYLWRKLPVNYPLKSFTALPTTPAIKFPDVQAKFPAETAASRKVREERQQAVKAVFLKSWKAYKKHAWMSDELLPVSGGKRNPFGGWAASLVDALDTLWIMDLKSEFEEAVSAVEAIDFTKTGLQDINVFETTIRYLGGFLSAYDLSNDDRLLRKAMEVGDLVFKAFDTPNHMPIMRWNLHDALKGEKQKAGSGTLSAEIGSLCMEFTRLSQITGDPRWFDATDRISEHLYKQQDFTELPGMWPLVVNAEEETFSQGNTFTLGAMADSLYEYLPKMAALMGGQLYMYQSMYQKAMDVAPKHNFFRPMTPTNEDILISTAVNTDKKGGTTNVRRDSQGQHLVCFLGGMLAIGSKLFSRPQDLDLAEKLTNGCIYTYKAFPHGVMPETFHMSACESKTSCTWDEKKWKQEVVKSNPEHGTDADATIASERLPPGFTRIPDRRYILRPEAIESVFVLYRVTGRQEFADSAWEMFSAVDKATSSELANSAVSDITRPAGEKPPQSDSMESFWMGETLKYAYLVFSDPKLISLDEYMFNTEAHPFKRLT